MKKITIIASILFCAILANNAFTTTQTISEVTVDGLIEATIGSSGQFYDYNESHGEEFIYGGEGYFARFDTWSKLEGDDFTWMRPTDVYEEGKTYGLWVCVEAKAGYMFDDETIYKVNGQIIDYGEVADYKGENTLMCGYYEFIPKPKEKILVDEWPEYVLAEDGETGTFVFDEENLFAEHGKLQISLDGEIWTEPYGGEKLTVPTGTTVYMQYVSISFRFYEDTEIHSVKIGEVVDDEPGVGEVDEVAEEPEVKNPNTSDGLLELWMMSIVPSIGIMTCGWYATKNILHYICTARHNTI